MVSWNILPPVTPVTPIFTHPKSGEFSGHVIGWRRLLSSHSFTGGPSKTPKISWLGLDQRWAVAIKERPFGDLLDFNPPTHNWYIYIYISIILLYNDYKYWFYTLDMHDRSWQHVRRSLLNRPAHRKSHLRAERWPRCGVYLFPCWPRNFCVAAEAVQRMNRSHPATFSSSSAPRNADI